MHYDIKILSDMAMRLGVVRNTLEKVIRLVEILKFINSHDYLKSRLALKGGTAINLFYDELPRLSVDLDLDYAINDEKDAMLKNREEIKSVLKSYFIREGYSLNKNSRFSYSLDAFVISYAPSGGGSDNIKVEINYSMRGHILEFETRQLVLPIIDDSFSFLTVSKIEIYAGKITALLSRGQIRDLYDTYQMIHQGHLNKHEIMVLKDVVIFYRYIQNDSLAYDSSFADKYTKRAYLRDLLPVLRKKDSFDLEKAKDIVSVFITQLMDYDEKHLSFIQSIKDKDPKFELLFEDNQMILSARRHPMVLWKSIKNKRNT